MGLVDSPNGDPKGRIVVLKMFENLAMSNGGAALLVRAGVLPWILSLMRDLCDQEKGNSAAIWFKSDERHMDTHAMLLSAMRTLSGMSETKAALAQVAALIDERVNVVCLVSNVHVLSVGLQVDFFRIFPSSNE